MYRAALLLLISLLTVCFTGSSGAYAQSEEKQPPFYGSLRSDLINVRTGPGVRYPIRWVYKREDWPVEVVTVFEDWYKIRDIEGVAGWAHKSLISNNRYALIEGTRPQPALKNPDPHAKTVFIMEPGVVAKLGNCNAGWCMVETNSYEGWTDQAVLWGAR